MAKTLYPLPPYDADELLEQIAWLTQRRRESRAQMRVVIGSAFGVAFLLVIALIVF